MGTGLSSSLSRAFTRRLNRGPTRSETRLGSAVKDPEDDPDYAPHPLQLVKRVPLFTTVGSRYPLLEDADVDKVNNVFSKVFAPVFEGHRNLVIDKHLAKLGADMGHMFIEIQEKITEINEEVFTNVASGMYEKEKK